MVLDPAVQARLDAANSTAKLGTGYLVTALVGEKSVSWVSVSKIDLRDTVTAAVNESAFINLSIQAIAT